MKTFREKYFGNVLGDIKKGAKLALWGLAAWWAVIALALGVSWVGMRSNNQAMAYGGVIVAAVVAEPVETVKIVYRALTK